MPRYINVPRLHPPENEAASGKSKGSQVVESQHPRCLLTLQGEMQPCHRELQAEDSRRLSIWFNKALPTWQDCSGLGKKSQN